MRITIKLNLDDIKYNNRIRSTVANVLRSLADDLDNGDIRMNDETDILLCGEDTKDVLGHMTVKE